MKKSTRIMTVAGGVLVGVLSLAPLTTYAEETFCDPTATATCNLNAYGTVTVNVASLLSLEIVDDTGTDLGNSAVASASGNSGQVLDTHFNAKVVSNKAYNIGLSAASAEDVNLHQEGTSVSDVIPGATGTIKVASGTSAWGIKKKTNNTDTDTGDYIGLTTTAVPFYTSTAGTSGTTTKFNVGISTNSSIASGTYISHVVVTASN